MGTVDISHCYRILSWCLVVDWPMEPKDSRDRLCIARIQLRVSYTYIGYSIPPSFQKING